MKVEFSPKFAEQVGATSFENLQNKYMGVPGTYRRYKNDRIMLKDHIKETFFDLLFWPLRLLPWGHIAEAWWFFLCTEGFYSALDGMAFRYIGDAYVVSLRDALNGKRHTWPVKFDDHTFKPYSLPLRYPLWLITRLVWPLFIQLYRQHREEYK